MGQGSFRSRYLCGASPAGVALRHFSNGSRFSLRRSRTIFYQAISTGGPAGGPSPRRTSLAQGTEPHRGSDQNFHESHPGGACTSLPASTRPAKTIREFPCFLRHASYRASSWAAFGASRHRHQIPGRGLRRLRRGRCSKEVGRSHGHRRAVLPAVRRVLVIVATPPENRELRHHGITIEK